VTLAESALLEKGVSRVGPFLEVLGRRLAALEEVARGSAGAPAASDRARASRVLAGLEGRWTDGDENLVRGFLDRWTPPGDDPRGAAARRLLAAADELARIAPPAGTVFFFLWEMESVLRGLLRPEAPGPRARIRSVRGRPSGRS